MAGEERLRPRPEVREAGPVLPLDFGAAARALRAERQAASSGHRQISLLHRGPLRILLFAFDEGGRLPSHRAPGQVVSQVLSGRISVETPHGRQELAAGQAVVLEPEVPHNVTALAASEMLLTVCLGPVPAPAA
jgi:quercetin dioxygenase-like cupin family protein